MTIPYKPICIFLLFFIFYPELTFPESKGLHFSGHEVVMEKRTSIDLSSHQRLCFNQAFELSFDIFFSPNQKDYFGYVFRAINDNDHNIDLIFDQKKKSFMLISGDEFTGIEFTIPNTILFEEWSNFRIVFDFLKDNITFYGPEIQQTAENIGLKDSRCFRIGFGVNNYNNFQTLDIPKMNIKDIKIKDNGKLKYWWPLEEDKGNIAIDKISGKKAEINNPTWIKSLHTKWVLEKSISVKGSANIAFDQKTEKIYIVSSETVLSYSVNDQRFDLMPNESKQLIWQGSQSITDNAGTLYGFYIDQNKVSAYNFEDKRWTSNFNYSDTLTEYWHANKFMSSIDSSLYIIGGYGQLEYKNVMFRYHIPTGKWEDWETKGEVFQPRYLAALGTTLNGDTAYILGGYGSSSGKQILGSKHYYDLMQYTVKDRSFKTISTLKPKDDNFAFANSLVIDSANFYGLVFPNNKFNSYLQLIQGSPNSAEYKLVGDRIPYNFHDVSSFADLFYDKKSKKLIAVTLFLKDGKTDVKIYSLSFPPNSLEEVVAESSWTGHWILFLGLGLILFITGFVVKKRIFSKTSTSPPKSIIVPERIREKPVSVISSKDKDSIKTDLKNVDPRNSIYVFGNFQAFDKEGADFTKAFTPLLKELFLLILLHSLRKESGISSKKLDEILWFEKSAKDARNNRSVNIAKLRNILDKVEGCMLNQDSGYWKITLDPNTAFCDYRLFLSLIKEHVSVDKSSVLELMAIVERGSILANCDYEWLDHFKSEVSNEAVSVFLKNAANFPMEDDPHFHIKLANAIFHFDPVNEEAMSFKCKALIHLGKHSLANDVYEKFSKNYHHLYGDSYDKSYTEVLQSL